MKLSAMVDTLDRAPSVAAMATDPFTATVGVAQDLFTELAPKALWLVVYGYKYRDYKEIIQKVAIETLPSILGRIPGPLGMMLRMGGNAFDLFNLYMATAEEAYRGDVAVAFSARYGELKTRAYAQANEGKTIDIPPAQG
jgi:hypothetical protein